MFRKKYMGIYIRLLIATFFFIPFCLHSQSPLKKTRILFLLDASSSMTYTWNEGYSRFDIASTILLKIMDSVYSLNNEVEFAVRAYGTNYPAQLNNCSDTKLEVPFNLQNTNQIKTRLKNITPIGASPIAFSLKKAAEQELSDAQFFDYSIIFITDGGESCQGDVCGVFQELLKKQISIKPYIIGLDKNEILKTYYSCLGNYIEVSTTDDIAKAVNLIIDANKKIIDKPKQLKLTTTYSNVPPIVPPTIKKDTIPAAVVKVDTVVPKPIVTKDSTFELRVTNGLPKLRIFKHPNIVKEKALIPSRSFKLKKYPDVTIRLNTDSKKINADFEALEPAIFSPQRSELKPFVAKAKKFKKEKVSLRFEYEEPRKGVVNFGKMEVYAKRFQPSNARPLMVGKKAVFKKQKASLAFEFEIPRIIIPSFEYLSSFQAPSKIKKSLPVMNGKISKFKQQKVKLKFEMEVVKKWNYAALNIVNYPKRYSYAFKMPKSANFKLSKEKVMLHFAMDAKPVAKKDTVKEVKVEDFPTIGIEYSTEVNPNPETMVQVYFKGNNGKTYPTATPIIQIQDISNGNVMGTFRREVKGNDPIPQKVTSGKYNLVIKGFDDLYAKDIVFKPNTLTKVYVKVTDGTLKFTYQGNISRPVKEYTAVVNRRFAEGATIQQKCTEILSYDPGTYYIEINTLPVTKASIDLTFDAIYEIQIREPGTLYIANTNKLGKVQIQSMLGDQFVTFMTVNLTGNLAEQRFQLLPNPYKLIYPADPLMPQAGSKELLFNIKSNSQIELELR